MGQRPLARCIKCQSVERTRLLWKYLEKEAALAPGVRVLHLAPEPGLYAAIGKRVATDDYHVADIDPDRFTFASNMRRIDLCDLDALPDNHYDLILHSHVLEHVPCTLAYPLFHLHRSLKETGRHVFVVPFMRGGYDECFAEIGDAERIRRFGQNDHVRKFGLDDVDRHLGALLEIDKDYDATRDFTEEELLEANIPREAWKGLSAHTVIMVRKYDMTLLRR
jgi:phosphoglycolate phosphatase